MEESDLQATEHNVRKVLGIKVFRIEETYDLVPDDQEQEELSDLEINQVVGKAAHDMQRWSTAYTAPASTEDFLFKDRIERYVRERNEFFNDWKKGQMNGADFKKRSAELGSLLALAYGAVNADSLDWTEETRSRARVSGWIYAQPSVDANTYTALQGIFRAVAMLALAVARLVAHELLSSHEGSVVIIIRTTYVLYAVWQIATLCYYPIWSGAKQSVAVALQNARGPKWVPAIKADTIVDEEGKSNSLRNKVEVQKDLDDARIKGENEDKLLKLKFELYTSELYTQLAIMKNQGDNRGVRAGLNIGAAVSSMAGALGAAGVVASGGLGPWWQFGWSVASLTLLSAQPLVYGARQGDAAAKDNLDKLASMFQIAAITGIGNLLNEDGSMNFGRLNRLVRGPVQLRLDYVRDILEYDRRVYVAGIIAHEKEATAKLYQTGNANAVGDLTLPGYAFKVDLDPLRGPIQHIFKDFKDAKTLAERKSYLTKISQGNPQDSSLEILQLYQNATDALETLAQGPGALMALLDKSSSLPIKSRQLIFGALKFAAGVSDAKTNEVCDERLSELKGFTESRTDVGSIHQAAQKIGQSLELGLAGPLGPNLIKAVFSIVHAGMIAEGPESAASIAYLTLAQGSFQILAGMVSVALGYAYHKHIFLKDTFRTRDATSGIVSLPNAGLLANNLSPKFSHSSISVYSTLLGEEIDHKYKPPVLNYKDTTRFFKDVGAQMIVVNPRKAFNAIWAVGGSLAIEGLKLVYKKEKHNPIFKQTVTADPIESDSREAGIVLEAVEQKWLKKDDLTRRKFIHSISTISASQGVYLSSLLSRIYSGKKIDSYGYHHFFPTLYGVFGRDIDANEGFDNVDHVQHYVMKPTLIEATLRCSHAINSRDDKTKIKKLFKDERNQQQFHSSLTSFYIATAAQIFQ